MSYATLAMIGDRRTHQWRSALDPNFPVAADRGPRNGAWDADSLTLRPHGKATEWAGNIASNDGHVQQFTFTSKDKASFVINDDNLFCSDDAEKSADACLGVFGVTTEKTTTAYWD